MAAWGAFLGLVPHVLHHLGPPAGAGLIAGASGKLLFAVIGLVACLPFLRRLRRRFHNWVAPAIAVAVFAATYTLSALLMG